jgi:zinc transport system permease protein
MIEFVEALTRYGFLQNAMLAGLLASLSSGVVGTYVVTRRISFLAGGIAHSVLGGMGAARYLQTVYGWSWLQPLHGAVVAAMVASLTIGWVSLRAREREDTVIGGIWAVGMALGVVFIANTPGYSEDLMSYLFGNILMVGPSDLTLMAALDLVVLGLVILFYNQFLAVCFDDEFAELRGIRVGSYYMLLLCLIGLTIVVLVTVVGLIMVIALLTLPIALAGRFTQRLWQIMIAAVIISMVLIAVGLGCSYSFDLPAGATIILLSGLVYLAVTAVAQLRRSG